MRTKTALKIVRDFQADRDIAYLMGEPLIETEIAPALQALKTLSERPYAHQGRDSETIPDKDIAYAIDHGE